MLFSPVTPRAPLCPLVIAKDQPRRLFLIVSYRSWPLTNVPLKAEITGSNPVRATNISAGQSICSLACFRFVGARKCLRGHNLDTTEHMTCSEDPLTYRVIEPLAGLLCAVLRCLPRVPDRFSFTAGWENRSPMRAAACRSCSGSACA